jgi:hypothetical protein
MIRIARALTLVPIVLGAIGIVVPVELVRIARLFESPSGLYLAAAIRVLLGAVLVLAASGARAPSAIRVIGGVVFVAGLLTPVVGLDRARAILEWWVAQGSLWTRVAGAVAVTFGSVLMCLLKSRAPTA